MRKRKLYVSELLKRNTNKTLLKVCIQTRFSYHYFDSIEQCLGQIDFVNEQVIHWNIDLLKYQLNISTYF